MCGFQPAKHHLLIIEALSDLVMGVGPKRKVLIMMPPGSAKSTYGSQLFPPWFLSHFPMKSVLACAHTTELAERWGRRCRNLIFSYPTELGIAMNPNVAASSRWQLSVRPRHPEDREDQMGEYLAAGVNTPIAGFRGDLGLIDDPVKGREQVQSQSQRDKVWDWYVYDFRPRLKPNAIQVVIMTRWNEDDLAGRLLDEEGDEWLQIKLPMIADDENDPLGRPLGGRLWPEWYTEQMVETAQRDPGLWLSLYQQRPTSDEGTYWKKAWLHAVAPGQVPPLDHLRIYGGSDYAVTARLTADYTVHAVVGIDQDDRPWLLDLWRERVTSEVWVDAWCEMVRFFRPMQWAEEQGQIISGVGPWLVRAQLKKQAWTERVQFVSRLDKGVRAQSMRGYIATNGLWYASDLPERAALEAELLSFPAGKNDDIHDALGLIGQLLDMAQRGQKPKPVVVKPKPEYRPSHERTDVDPVKVL